MGCSSAMNAIHLFLKHNQINVDAVNQRYQEKKAQKHMLKYTMKVEKKQNIVKKRVLRLDKIAKNVQVNICITEHYKPEVRMKVRLYSMSVTADSSGKWIHNI